MNWEKYYKNIQKNRAWWLTALCMHPLITDLHTNTSLPFAELFHSELKCYILFFGINVDMSSDQI